MKRNYAWIPSCLASDAKMNCQAITNLIGETGENMNRTWNRQQERIARSESQKDVILKHIPARTNSRASIASFKNLRKQE
jgi:hypothetical protein